MLVAFGPVVLTSEPDLTDLLTHPVHKDFTTNCLFHMIERLGSRGRETAQLEG